MRSTRFLSFMFISIFLAFPLKALPFDKYDLVIKNGTIYDGSGAVPYRADIAVVDDKIQAIGDASNWQADQVVDADGLAVAPGFINVLSWANYSLMHDGRGLSDIVQGVTLEVFGEGISMAPLNSAVGDTLADMYGADFIEPDWRSFGEYMQQLEVRGISPNVASFVGATTLRIYVLGHEDRRPTADELKTMQGLVEQSMLEGALGVGSSLIYAPAFYADTDELVALSKAASKHGGIYISHMRSEGGRIEEAIDEVIAIGRSARIPVEIYHLKLAGKPNWSKYDAVIDKIEDAREEGIRVTADIYVYPAGGTGLTATMPPWVLEGGFASLIKRLSDRRIRQTIIQQMNEQTDDWENFFLAAGPENIVPVLFQNSALSGFAGKSISEIAALRNQEPEDVIIDLILEDGSDVGAIYYLMSEENIRKKVQLPWVSFGSDAETQPGRENPPVAPTHPRAYGNFARVLGKYVREEKLLSLEEAVRRMTSLPADNFNIQNRGRIKPGYFADIAVFDPETVTDRATFEQPHANASGVRHVIVNGVQVLEDGEHTGATPGRFVKGPGWRSP